MNLGQVMSNILRRAEMDPVTKFMVYCIEEYKKANDLSGKEVISLFGKYQVLDYICDFYESLHTTGPEYIVEDIESFIEERNSVV